MHQLVQKNLNSSKALTNFNKIVILLFYVESTDSEINGDYAQNSAIASNPTGDNVDWLLKILPVTSTENAIE